jgi:hypothetical protein
MPLFGELFRLVDHRLEATSLQVGTDRGGALLRRSA